MKLPGSILVILILAFMAMGCVQENKDKSSYTVSDAGVLTLRCGTPSVSESPGTGDGPVSISRIVFNGPRQKIN